MTGSPKADDADELIERAAHSAHAMACHLQLLITACSAHAGEWLRLSASAFVDAMHELSACAEELADHLDAMSMLACSELRQQVNECWCVATRLSGLMRVVSDVACEPRLMELEVAAESLIGSLQKHWAERVQGIEEVLQGARGRARACNLQRSTDRFIGEW